jgi:ketosteroid isomerase-like protein
MKTINRISSVILTLLLALGVASIAKAQTASPQVTQEITNLRNEWMAAEMRKDIPFLDHLMADDFVVGNSQGQVMNKAEYLESQRRPDRILKISPGRDVQVRQYGVVAVLTEFLTLNASDKGVPFGGEFRFVRIFAKEDGRWRPVLAQGTPVPHK